MLFDKITKLGRYFLAIPMIVFGIQHFMYAEFVVSLVPTWIPAPLFWTYFAGVALFAAGAGIIINVLSRLAATLLGSMISIWVIILHIPRVFANSGDNNEFINVFNALFILSGAYLLAASLPGKPYMEKITSVGAKVSPFLIAISLAVFGIEHFTHGKLVFIVGAPNYEFPGTTVWVYLSGFVFVLSAAGILFSKKSSLICFFLGIFILFVTTFFFVPQIFSYTYQGHALATFLKGVAMSGSALILSGASAKEGLRSFRQSIPINPS